MLEAVNIVKDLSNEDYHGDASFSSSQLKTALSNIELFKKKHIDKSVPNYSSKAFKIGTLFHELILEPHIFEPVVFTGRMDKRTKKYQDFLKENPDVRPDNIVTENELVQLKYMEDSLRSHKDCPDFSATTNELSVFYKDQGMDFRIRPDAICKKTKTILDLKTTSGDVGKKDFYYHMLKYGYDLSAAMYVRGLSAHTNVDYKFTLVVVQTVEPYTSVIYELGPGIMEVGKEKYEAAINKIKACRDSKQFVFQEKSEILDINNF